MRETLALTQEDLAQMIGKSVAAIQSIETGRLKLSKSLAAKISNATGADYSWLLRNDLSAPMPPRPFFSEDIESYGLQRYVNTVCLLIDVFSRLFAVARRLGKTGASEQLELSIATELAALKKADKEKDARPINQTTKDVFAFFARYGGLDPELDRLLDLDYLIETAPAEIKRPVRIKKKPGRKPGGRNKPKTPG
jgi:transcriptional regulator with XRE-family HTH domain